MSKLEDPKVMKQIYQTAKLVYRGELTKSAASKLLVGKTIFSEASLKMYFNIYESMRKGTCYKMGTSAAFTQFLIENIFKDYGRDAMLTALSAAKQNSDYRISCDNEQPGIAGVCKELIEKYNLGISYNELDKYQESGQTFDEQKCGSFDEEKSQNIQMTTLGKNRIRVRYSVGPIEFDAEGDRDFVLREQNYFESEILGNALRLLMGKDKVSSKEKEKSEEDIVVESIGGKLLKNHSEVIRFLENKMDFKAKMIPLLFIALQDGLAESFSIRDVQDILLETLSLKETKKDIENILKRRSDWFEMKGHNPRRFSLLDVGMDYSRNILNDCESYTEGSKNRMITDKQFDDAFTAAGGWFILTQFETVYNWKGEKSDLVDKLYLEGFDNNRKGTTTRVSSLLRILNNDRGKDALLKIRDSNSINRNHPEAFSLASKLISKYY